MSDLNTRCLDTFPEWLRSLPADAGMLAEQLADESLSEESRLQVAGALNYLFKSLDLIPDGIEDLGFLDDAFVLRVAARVASAKSDATGPLAALGAQGSLVEELLGKDYARLVAYTEALKTGAARGRTAADIVKDAEVRAVFMSELHAWAESYVAPTFSRDEKNLVKLTSFMSAKLPA